MVRIIAADSKELLAQVRILFREYAAELVVDLCWQGFEREVAELPGSYAPPQGRLFLAFGDTQMAGCGALRKISSEICEMKRLYVRSPFRGWGLGRMLTGELICAARTIGYTRMRLDTLPSMRDALGLYHSLGFREIAPYCYNPVPGAIFLELALL